MADEGRASDRRATYGSEGGWSHQERGNVHGEFGRRHRERRRSAEQGGDEGEPQEQDCRTASEQEVERFLNEEPPEEDRGDARLSRLNPVDDRRQGFVGKGPCNYQRPDARILEDVCDRLTEAPDVDATGISVCVEDGEVRLDGTVPNRFMKHRATDIAHHVSGVKRVRNELAASDE